MANKNTVVFINTSKEVKKAMEGLAKSALRASGKIIRKKLRENVPLRTKNFKNHIGTWVFIGRENGVPQMQVGFYGWQRVKKRGKTPSQASPYWVEFGTTPHIIPGGKDGWVPGHFMHYEDMIFGFKVNHPGTRATNVLRDTVYNNMDEIRAAQEEYLAELNKAIESAQQKIENGEEFEDDD